MWIWFEIAVVALIVGTASLFLVKYFAGVIRSSGSSPCASHGCPSCKSKTSREVVARN